jgi:hypothetical protein
MAILSALSELGGDRLLISIDPNQSSGWRSVGAQNVRANGFSNYHRLIEAPDYLALPDLAPAASVGGDGLRGWMAHV